MGGKFVVIKQNKKCKMTFLAIACCLVISLCNQSQIKHFIPKFKLHDSKQNDSNHVISQFPHFYSTTKVPLATDPKLPPAGISEFLPDRFALHSFQPFQICWVWIFPSQFEYAKADTGDCLVSLFKSFRFLDTYLVLM